MRVVICAFNEARILPVCLSRIPRGTQVTVIDGAYAGYPHRVPWSTDGTCEIAERWGADVVRVTEAWPDQIAKRSFSLTLDETVFVLDADEILVDGCFPTGIQGDIGWILMTSPLYPEPYPEPRIFKVRPGWHYAGRHHWIYDADGNLVTSHRAKGIQYAHEDVPLTVLNARHWREGGRLRQKSDYVRSRDRTERTFHDESCIGREIAPLHGLPRVKR